MILSLALSLYLSHHAHYRVYSVKNHMGEKRRWVKGRLKVRLCGKQTAINQWKDVKAVRNEKSLRHLYNIGERRSLCS